MLNLRMEGSFSIQLCALIVYKFERGYLFFYLIFLRFFFLRQPLILQYVPHMMKSWSSLYSRYAVLFSVAVVWAYAAVLTVAGAYNNKPPNTQLSCRVDRAGLIGAAPW